MIRNLDDVLAGERKERFFLFFMSVASVIFISDQVGATQS